MISRAALAATLALALVPSACAPGPMLRSETVGMTVTNRKDGTRRFWVSLVEDDTGIHHKQIRFSGKYCSNGPDRLPYGRHVTVRMNVYRSEKTGQEVRRIDTSDLDRQFC